MIELLTSVSTKYKTLFEKYEVNTPLRKAHFLAQIHHESNGGKSLVENLNYSSEGLSKTFLKYFSTIEKANNYAGNPLKIANLVYANRMGNGDEASGDGFRYRGAGYIQLTGKENYKRATKALGIDFIGKPELLQEEANAILVSLWWWFGKGLNDKADNDDINGITKSINGGLNGLEHRKSLLKEYKALLNKN